MLYKLPVVVLAALFVCSSAVAQSPWSAGYRLELRADYRWSDDERHPVPFPPGAAMQTPDPGHHVELNVADLQLDTGYGEMFAARVKVHFQAKHRRNPTSTDRLIDADELFVRFGRHPQFLERPEKTSFFVQAGKFPKMERQPVRLLESYGLAATSFNRFEDVQVLTGGTIGRNFYWRVQAANGNPLFFRDPNALAGDNGTEQELRGEVKDFGTGFPILYNAETEDLFFNTEHVQWGEAIGYRWQRDDQTAGFDAILFHYSREMSDREELTGTAYGGDLDLLVVEPAEVGGAIARPVGLPLDGRNKTEYGARVYAEWHAATFIGQFTQQEIAGNERHGWELEAGYRIPLDLGPIESIQPAVRASSLRNDFGNAPGFPARSILWNWDKVDAGVRVDLERGLDVTVEYTQHQVESLFPLELREALVTVRWRG
ncbi:MAG TPA: hypothetical protein VEO54_24870 [Thermoanaerobaculia bacterium]|nr:hypothetical protein [Thermoanaerobaculia bacterium]